MYDSAPDERTEMGTPKVTEYPKTAPDRAVSVQRFADYRVIKGAEDRIDEMGSVVTDYVTCGHCGATWNDAAVSGVTPAPAGRCPFEYEHQYDD